MTKSTFDRRWGSKDLRGWFWGGRGRFCGRLPGGGVHLPNAGRPFTKMGGPYTASLELYGLKNERQGVVARKIC